MDAEAITALLEQWHAGDRAGLDAALLALLPQLRRIAHRRLAQERAETLQTTALVHEFYLRFAGSSPHIHGRAHLLALAARVMRHVLVDYARTRLREKRGGDVRRVSLDDVEILTETRADEVLRINEALRRLEDEHGRQAQVFQMRFFGGLSVAETAEALDLSENTVIRDWSTACATLRAHLQNP